MTIMRRNKAINRRHPHEEILPIEKRKATGHDDTAKVEAARSKGGFFSQIR
ncbi:hypothetical protein DSOL_3239 [Desulfosporosinus metallidurans]|uniref:Uncharacterized protein n=1 Tax=Desulfosporosinus metallidurans TaxID=1888891 RepID=A0A1Q8QS12_9FIRM|nr:hypothetical protein DSOL_3239 [Desulfosporosinus metallidurans]